MKCCSKKLDYFRNYYRYISVLIGASEPGVRPTSTLNTVVKNGNMSKRKYCFSKLLEIEIANYRNLKMLITESIEALFNSLNGQSLTIVLARFTAKT